MKILFTILASIFLAYDSGKFYSAPYELIAIGWVISGLAYAGFALVAYEHGKRPDWKIKAVLGLFLVVNTLSATVGASGELLNQWEKTLSISHNSEAIHGLRGLAENFNSQGAGLNAAKNANAYRELTIASVENYKPLAWVKIGLNLAVRILLEFCILILAGGSRKSRMVVESEPKADEPTSRNNEPKSGTGQPKLKGVGLNKYEIEKIIKDIDVKMKEENPEPLKIGRGRFGKDRMPEVRERAVAELIRIKKEK